MLLSLPAAAYLLLLLLMREKRLDWRRAALAAAVLWGTCVALSTETLSAVRLISRGPLAIFWLTVCVFLDDIVEHRLDPNAQITIH